MTDSINKTFVEIVRKKGKEENFMRLLVLYLMGTMLFPKISCSVPSWIVDYVEDLPTLARYVWAEATHKWLLKDVPQMASAHT